MDGGQLRDEALRDRVRAAVEFLDPSEFLSDCRGIVLFANIS